MNLDFFENKYFFAVFAIFSSLYAFQIRPQLPDFLVKLFQNSIFRILILFLVLVRGYKDPQFSLLVAVAFIVIMDAVRQHVFKESFADATIDKASCEANQLVRNKLDACYTSITNMKATACDGVAEDKKLECNNQYKTKKGAILDMFNDKDASQVKCVANVKDFAVNTANKSDQTCDTLIKSLYEKNPDYIKMSM